MKRASIILFAMITATCIGCGDENTRRSSGSTDKEEPEINASDTPIFNPSDTPIGSDGLNMNKVAPNTYMGPGKPVPVFMPEPAKNPPSIAPIVDYPELKEITPLFSLSIDSDEVQAFVKKYDLKKTYKFDSGSFRSNDNAYYLWFDGGSINTIGIRVSKWSKEFSDPHWSIYPHSMPGNLQPTDGPKEVTSKLGKPTGKNRWLCDSLLLWVHFNEQRDSIESVSISVAQ